MVRSCVHTPAADYRTCKYPVVDDYSFLCRWCRLMPMSSGLPALLSPSVLAPAPEWWRQSIWREATRIPRIRSRLVEMCKVYSVAMTKRRTFNVIPGRIAGCLADHAQWGNLDE